MIVLLLLATLGARGAAATPAMDLVHATTLHLEATAPAGSLAARDLPSIVAEREKALAEIARLFGVPAPDGVRLAFYPDEAAKERATGHAGLGWAEGKLVEEVYSDSVRLDPYHELVHIVGAEVGHPPALFDEGFAVYVSERLGADALALLGHEGTRIRAAACELVRSREALPLETLFDFTEIGSPDTKGPIAYPESAAFVQFLVEQYGLERFRKAFHGLAASTEPSVRQTNRAELLRIYGKSLADLDSRWRASVCP